MPEALLLLMRLQLRGWLRALARNLRTVKGAILALAGAFVFVSWLGSVLVSPRPAERPDPELLERFGPLGLLASCVLGLVFSSGGKAVSFSPAEVDFLFPGPFTRRQLLAYKIAGTVGLGLPSTLLLTLFARGFAGWFVAAYVGLLLTVLFFQFFTLAAGLLAQTVGARAYTRGRKALLVVLGLLVAGVALHAYRSAPEPDVRAVLERMEESAVWQTVRVPLTWFIKAYLAERLWPDLVQWAGLAALVDLGLLALVFALDAQYLEAAASASERLYVLRQRLRSGQGTLVGPGGEGKARFRLPGLPWWGGAGPTIWRQWTTAVRSYLPIIVLVTFLALAVPPVLAGPLDPADTNVPLALVLAAMFGGLTVLMSPAVPCDFRADLDRLDVLKALPIAPAWLTLGELLAPTLLVSLLQLLTIAVVQVVRGRFQPELFSVLAASLPFAFLVFALENLLFLLFPARAMGATPGDVQAMGRNMLLLLAKMIVLVPALVVAGVAGALAYWLAGHSIAVALPAAGLVLAVCDAALVPLVGLAFKRFDVARDTPP